MIATAPLKTTGASVERLYHFWVTRVMTSRREEKTYYFFLPDEHAVRKEVGLMDDGAIVLSIRQKKHARWQRELFSRTYKMSFLSAMMYQTEVGASPGTALRRVIELEKNPRKRIDLEPALQILNGGGQFSDAVDALDIFDKPIIAILKAGEETGLREAIKDAKELLGSREGVLASFLSVLGRLTRDIILALVSVFSIQFWVFPYLQNNAPQTGDPLKLAEYNTSIANGIFYNGILVWIAVVVGCCFIFTVLAMLASRKARDKASEMMIRVPVIRSMIFDNLLSDSFLLMARMLQVDIHQMNALLILASISPMKYVSRIWMNIHSAVGNGEDFAAAVYAQGILREEEEQAFASYGNNVHLTQLLMATANNRRVAAAISTKRFKSLVTYITFAYISASIGVVLLVMKVQDLSTAIGFETIMK